MEMDTKTEAEARPNNGQEIQNKALVEHSGFCANERTLLQGVYKKWKDNTCKGGRPHKTSEAGRHRRHRQSATIMQVVSC